MDAGEAKVSSTRNARSWNVRFVGAVMLLVAIAAALMMGAEWFPNSGQHLVAIEVADPDSLQGAVPGVQHAIPVRVTNRSNRPIRIVGNNAC